MKTIYITRNIEQIHSRFYASITLRKYLFGIFPIDKKMHVAFGTSGRNQGRYFLSHWDHEAIGFKNEIMGEHHMHEALQNYRSRFPKIEFVEPWLRTAIS